MYSLHVHTLPSIPNHVEQNDKAAHALSDCCMPGWPFPSLIAVFKSAANDGAAQHPMLIVIDAQLTHCKCVTVGGANLLVSSEHHREPQARHRWRLLPSWGWSLQLEP